MKKEERNVQQVLEDELISIGVFTKELAANPTKALSEIIAWHCQVALDPNISKQAEMLVKRGYKQGYAAVMDSLRL